jgi:hypothetical protein
LSRRTHAFANLKKSSSSQSNFSKNQCYLIVHLPTCVAVSYSVVQSTSNQRHTYTINITMNCPPYQHYQQPGSYGQMWDSLDDSTYYLAMPMPLQNNTKLFMMPSSAQGVQQSGPTLNQLISPDMRHPAMPPFASGGRQNARAEYVSRPMPSLDMRRSMMPPYDQGVRRSARSLDQTSPPAMLPHANGVPPDRCGRNNCQGCRNTFFRVVYTKGREAYWKGRKSQYQNPTIPGFQRHNRNTSNNVSPGSNDTDVDQNDAESERNDS